MSDVEIYEASLILGVPNFLIRDMVRFEFNGQKLPAKTDSTFERGAIIAYANHLESAWPETKREPPEWVERYLVWESGNACGLCRLSKPNYEVAHVRDWAKTHCHSPKNLVRLCLDCHRSHGADYKLLQGVKEELLRERALLPNDVLYDCADQLVVGDAVVLRDGFARSAIASSETDLSVGFIRAKVGAQRCSVVRFGLAVGLDALTTGVWYFLSPIRPGKIDTFDAVLAEYELLMKAKSPQFFWQRVGRAESAGHLFIQMTHGIGLPSASRISGV